MEKVDFYAIGVLTRRVYFPNGKTVCGHCPYYSNRTAPSGTVYKICLRTYEPLSDVWGGRGIDCPLEFEGEISERRG